MAITSLQSGLSRRAFSRLAVGSAAAGVLSGARGEPAFGADERSWRGVREQFLLDPDTIVMNAANLCPASRPIIDLLQAKTRDVDRDPSQENRAKLLAGREETRKLLAEFLRVTPEEIVITRNTSEANNLVSSGVDLKAGDEVVLFSDNHPSNHAAWTEKAKRFGFTVRVVEQVNPHPGPDYYLDAFSKAISPRTRLLSFTHLTSTCGDLFPAAALCKMARERSVLTLVDGAQTFGQFDVDLGALGADFYTGSGHKWPCGPRETGILYIRQSAQARIHPSTISVYAGASGISKTFEGLGQRDDAALIAFGEALRFQMKIGRKQIEERARDLTQALIAGLRKIDGVRVWTHPDPARSAGIVSFQPAGLDPRKLGDALYTRDHIAGAIRAGSDRPGLRFSPHFYNSHAEVEKVLAAVRRYVSSGV